MGLNVATKEGEIMTVFDTKIIIITTFLNHFRRIKFRLRKFSEIYEDITKMDSAVACFFATQNYAFFY